MQNVKPTETAVERGINIVEIKNRQQERNVTIHSVQFADLVLTVDGLSRHLIEIQQNV